MAAQYLPEKTVRRAQCALKLSALRLGGVVGGQLICNTKWIKLKNGMSLIWDKSLAPKESYMLFVFLDAIASSSSYPRMRKKIPSK